MYACMYDVHACMYVCVVTNGGGGGGGGGGWWWCMVVASPDHSLPLFSSRMFPNSEMENNGRGYVIIV